MWPGSFPNPEKSAEESRGWGEHWRQNSSSADLAKQLPQRDQARAEDRKGKATWREGLLKHQGFEVRVGDLVRASLAQAACTRSTVSLLHGSDVQKGMFPCLPGVGK